MTIILAVPPAQPGGQRPQCWRCRVCLKVLGLVLGERVAIRHSRRTIEASLPCSQVCDNCGTFNTLDKPDDKA